MRSLLSLVFTRLWYTFGWWGLYGMLVAAVAVGAAVHVGFVESVHYPAMWKAVLPVSVSVVVVVVRWGRPTRPSSTARWQDVVDPLVSSKEEFCLVLRPFGADGRIITRLLPARRLPLRQVGDLTPTVTLEQLIGGCVTKSLGLRTFALVDQDQILAPAGPVWLRASNTDWQQPVDAMIRRAHTIVLVLPPGQQIRESVRWEIRQIARNRRQYRVVIILPPHDRDESAYRASRRQAAVVLAALEDPFGEVSRVSAEAVAEHERNLGTRALVARLSPDGPRWWVSVPRRWSRLGTGTYEDCLTEALSQGEGKAA